MSAEGSILEVRRVSRVYKDGERVFAALSDLSFSVVRGELVGLGGSSGSGKSTLLNILGLADAPSSGTVFMRGHEVPFANERELSKHRRRLGYVFQYFNLLPTLTALENVMLPLMLLSESHRAAAQKAQQALDELGLGDKSRSFPHELSGGQMQRVAICRATVHRPDIVLADEPSGNLDSVNGQLVFELLRSLSRLGITVIVASHNTEFIAQCDRVLTLKDGRLIS